MTAIYITVQEVADKLRTTFGTSTEITEDVVEGWIEDAQDYIDELAGRSWQGVVAVEEELYDYDSTGVIVVKRPGLVSVQSVQYTPDSGATWTTISPSAYVVYSDYDTIELRPSLTTGEYPVIPYGQQKLRLSYTYGSSVVPPRIKRLAEDMVVMDAVQSLVSSSANTQGGTVQVGPIRVSDPSAFSLNALKGMESSVRARLDSLSGSRIKTTIGKNFSI
jgi:hypothetical protein